MPPPPRSEETEDAAMRTLRLLRRGRCGWRGRGMHAAEATACAAVLRCGAQRGLGDRGYLQGIWTHGGERGWCGLGVRADSMPL